MRLAAPEVWLPVPPAAPHGGQSGHVRSPTVKPPSFAAAAPLAGGRRSPASAGPEPSALLRPATSTTAASPSSSSLVITWSFTAPGGAPGSAGARAGIGALMVAVGSAWATLLVDTRRRLRGQARWPPTLDGAVQLLLTFPEGRLRDRGEWLLAGAAWFSGVALQVARVLSEPAARFCEKCATNAARRRLPDRGRRLLFALQVLVGAGADRARVHLVRRWRGATPASAAPSRRCSGRAPARSDGLWSPPRRCKVAKAPSGVAAASSFSAFLLRRGPLRLHGRVLRRLPGGRGLERPAERLGELPVSGGDLAIAAEALGDPSLQLAYWLPSEERYADASGQPPGCPPRAAERFVSVVSRRGPPRSAR